MDGTTRVSMDCDLCGEKESDLQAIPALVTRERRHKMDVGDACSAKATECPWVAKRVAKFNDQLEHCRITFRCDSEPAIEALA